MTHADLVARLAKLLAAKPEKPPRVLYATPDGRERMTSNGLPRPTHEASGLAQDGLRECAEVEGHKMARSGNRTEARAGGLRSNPTAGTCTRWRSRYADQRTENADTVTRAQTEHVVRVKAEGVTAGETAPLHDFQIGSCEPTGVDRPRRGRQGSGTAPALSSTAAAAGTVTHEHKSETKD